MERTLAGENDLLKERVIGSEVFGRGIDYDPGSDPIVRVRAAEVRKRLAQYYQNCPESRVHIDIPPGSYRAVFLWTPPPLPQAIIKKSWRPPRWSWISLTVLLAAVSLVAARGLHTTPTALDQFWAPALASPKPILIYNASANVFRPRDLTDSTDDMVAVRGQYLCIGDAYTSVVLSSLLTHRGKLFQIRYGSDLSFGDLRYQPSILIGAFNNAWTLQTTADLRFVFEKHPTIRDRSDNRLYTLPDLGPDGRTSEDYAVVSRVFDSKTGELLIAAAGITQYGTRAAGEFLTSPQWMTAFERSAPAGWQKKNLQVLLHTQVVGETPGPPTVVLAHFW
ncbi:MAG: hypothetical protein ABI759_10495 [Candidatus Solibacter sp.]